MSPGPGSVNNGLTTRVTRKGYAVSGDRRHLPQGEASIKKDGGRRSVTGAERQSKAEPDEDGKALGGSAVPAPVGLKAEKDATRKLTMSSKDGA
jgi:hypothetical protein